MNKKNMGKQAGSAKSDDRRLLSIDELLCDHIEDFHPVIREYMYLSAVPFFGYYQEKTKKYLGEKAAKEYRVNIQRLTDYIEKESEGENIFLIDILFNILKEGRVEYRYNFLQAALMFPIRVVRIQRFIKSEKEKSHD